jgi:putative transposase
MQVQRAYRTELDPTNTQRTVLWRHAGTARFAYNWGLQRKEEAYLYNQLPHPPVKTPTAIDLHRELNRLKPTEFPWMYEISKCAPQEALRDLDRAYRNFFEGRAKHPRFHSRHSGRSSFRRTGTIEVEDGHITLPRGVHLRSATISERAGRWYVSLAVEEERPAPVPIPGMAVGVDLGIHTLATVSDGTVFPNPRSWPARERKLKHLQREVSRKKKGRRNRAKAKC